MHTRQPRLPCRITNRRTFPDSQAGAKPADVVGLFPLENLHRSAHLLRSGVSIPGALTVNLIVAARFGRKANRGCVKTRSEGNRTRVARQRTAIAAAITRAMRK